MFLLLAISFAMSMATYITLSSNIIGGVRIINIILIGIGSCGVSHFIGYLLTPTFVGTRDQYSLLVVASATVAGILAGILCRDLLYKKQT